MTPQAIRDAINGDPTLQALVPDTDAIASALRENYTAPARITVRQLLIWAAPEIRAKLEDARLNVQSPVRSLALSAIDLLRKNMDDLFDPVANATFLDALQAAALITSAQRDELTALSNQPVTVTELDVRRAIYNDDGSLAV